MMADIAGWIAPTATAIAAIMTAANLGTRVTGWGFVIFTVGSVAWSCVALQTSQTNLLLSNGFLTIINLIGIWRWLGRQARHDDGRDTAARRSAASEVPTLFGIGSLGGASLTDRAGAPLGKVIDAMMRRDGSAIAYVVVSEGGVAGMGERLHAIDPVCLEFGETVRCGLTAAELSALPVLSPGNWPVSIHDVAHT